jgi:hypothetical protein
MKRRRDSRPFVGLHKELIFGCPEYAALSPTAKSLYSLLKAKLNPSKGEEICLSYRQVLNLKYKGLHSTATIAKAFKELADQGWAEPLERGGLFHLPSKWRLTWKFDQFNAGRRER